MGVTVFGNFSPPQPTSASIGCGCQMQRRWGKTHVRPEHQQKAPTGLDTAPMHTPSQAIQGQQCSLPGKQTSLVRGSAWHLIIGLYTGSDQPGHPTLKHHRRVNFTYLAYFGITPFPPAGMLGPPFQRLSSLPAKGLLQFTVTAVLRSFGFWSSRSPSLVE